MSKKEKKVDFAQKLQQLEEIVDSMEEGNLSLEESVTLFAQGQKLATECRKRLETAVLQVEQLKEDGTTVEFPID